MTCCDFDLTFDFTVVTLTLKIWAGVYLVGMFPGDCRCAPSWCELGVTFHLASARMFSSHLRHIFPVTKQHGLLQLIFISWM